MNYWLMLKLKKKIRLFQKISITFSLFAALYNFSLLKQMHLQQLLDVIMGLHPFLDSRSGRNVLYPNPSTKGQRTFTGVSFNNA